MTSRGPHNPPPGPEWRHEHPTRAQIRRDQEERLKRDMQAGEGLRRQRAFIIAAIVIGVLITAAIASAAIFNGNGGDENALETGSPAEKAAREETGPESGLSAVAGIAGRPRIEVAKPETARPAGPLAGRTITIDPGHAANPDLGMEPNGPGSGQLKVKDPGGTSGAVTGIPEHAVNLAISLKLKQLLEAEGARVVMTRETDTYVGGNVERAQAANQSDSHLLLRIHCDGSEDPARNGISTLYPSPIPGWTDDIDSESRRAAQSVQTALVAATGAADNGIAGRSDITGFNWADVPAILVEAGYLSNPQEDLSLNSPEYQQVVVGAILEGIKNFFLAAE